MERRLLGSEYKYPCCCPTKVRYSHEESIEFGGIVSCISCSDATQTQLCRIPVWIRDNNKEPEQMYLKRFVE